MKLVRQFVAVYTAAPSDALLKLLSCESKQT
jgi:hypothetical protein